MGFTGKMVESAADARLREILDAVRVVFAAKGFDRASMQDLAQAANMSAGNFYRYFPSKDAIIEAMIARDLAGVEASFALIMAAEQPRTLLRAAIAEQLDEEDCDGAALWSEIIAAAKRRSEIGRVFERLEEAVIGYLTEVFGRIAGVDSRTAERRFSAHARIMFMLIQGVKMRRRPDDAFPTSDLRALALRTIDSLLDEIVPEPAPAAVPAPHESV